MQNNLEQLLDEYGGLISRVASAYEANFAIRQELVQEMVLHVWQALKQFRGESQLKTYILKIAHNRGVHHVTGESRRNANMMSEEHLPGDIAVDCGQAENQIMLDSMLNEIRKLPFKQKQVITLHLEGLKYQEIAEVSGVSATNVGVMINRIRKQLMEVIGNE